MTRDVFMCLSCFISIWSCSLDHLSTFLSYFVCFFFTTEEMRTSMFIVSSIFFTVIYQFLGKTATIVALVKLLVSLKYSVLVTSQTHSAVDNIILRLKNSVNVLRLGSVTRVHPDVKSCCEENLIMKQSIRTTEELERFYNQWVMPKYIALWLRTT